MLPDTLTIPIAIPLTGGVILLILAAERFILPRDSKDQSALIRTKHRLGMGETPLLLVIILALFWCALFLALFGGLLFQFHDLATQPFPEEDADQLEWRFLLTKLVAMTGVLAAVVALPFTLIRLRMTQEQNDLAGESLYNEKMNSAVADLYSQRQITRWTGDIASNGWQDDIPRRNGAIDRLKGLCDENNALRPRVDRLLSVYLRELSREHPPEERQGISSRDNYNDWTFRLASPRSDMENVAQTLTRLKREPWSQNQLKLPDLQGMNLQGFNFFDLYLKNANLNSAFLQGAWLGETNLQGADLSGTELQGANLDGALLHEASLSGAQLQGAHFGSAQLIGTDLTWTCFDSFTSVGAAKFTWAAVKEVDLTKFGQIAEHLEKMFGDRSVILPEEATYPTHWPDEELEEDDFYDQWRAWQRENGYTPDNPQ